MTQDPYIANKVKDALAATNNNRHDAQMLLITWAVKDATLLLGLTKPHLKAIASAHIDHALHPLPSNDETPPQTTFTKKEADAMIAPPALGKTEKPSNIPPPKSSLYQATIMQELANAYKRNKE